MRIFKWDSEFSPSKESSFAPVWIRIANLPLYFFEVKTLLSIVHVIGSPILIDPRNVDRTDFSYASFCVELDVAKPLIHSIWINLVDKDSKVVGGFEVQVSYVVVPSYCSECSHIGHDKEHCKRLMADKVLEELPAKDSLIFSKLKPQSAHGAKDRSWQVVKGNGSVQLSTDYPYNKRNNVCSNNNFIALDSSSEVEEAATSKQHLVPQVQPELSSEVRNSVMAAVSGISVSVVAGVGPTPFRQIASVEKSSSSSAAAPAVDPVSAVVSVVVAAADKSIQVASPASDGTGSTQVAAAPAAEIVAVAQEVAVSSQATSAALVAAIVDQHIHVETPDPAEFISQADSALVAASNVSPVVILSPATTDQFAEVRKGSIHVVAPSVAASIAVVATKEAFQHKPIADSPVKVEAAAHSKFMDTPGRAEVDVLQRYEQIKKSKTLQQVLQVEKVKCTFTASEQNNSISDQQKKSEKEEGIQIETDNHQKVGYRLRAQRSFSPTGRPSSKLVSLCKKVEQLQASEERAHLKNTKAYLKEFQSQVEQARRSETSCPGDMQPTTKDLMEIEDYEEEFNAEVKRVRSTQEATPGDNPTGTWQNRPRRNRGRNRNFVTPDKPRYRGPGHY